MQTRPVMFYVQAGILLIYLVLALLFIFGIYFKPYFNDTQRVGFGLLLLAYATFRSVMFYQKYFRRNQNTND